MNRIESGFVVCGAALVLALSGAVHAQEIVEPPPVSASKPIESLVATYSDFAGSDENAEALVNGLRHGREITLNSGDAGGGTMTFTGATKPMGYGNVNIALALAQQELASQGITEPTPEQIRVALNGGSITTADGTFEHAGILTLRGDGLGWGQIANALGFRLGEVVSASRTDKAQTSEQTQRSERADRSEGTDRGNVARVDRPMRMERPHKIERVVRPDRPERPGK